jgi:hypothetical protein
MVRPQEVYTAAVADLQEAELQHGKVGRGKVGQGKVGQVTSAPTMFLSFHIQRRILQHHNPLLFT